MRPPAGADGLPENGAMPVEAAEGSPEEAFLLPVEDWLDLHTFRPEETVDLVTEYLRLAVEAGLTEVRIVHGRGHGVQRAIVRRLLASSPLVRGFGDAPGERGGWGATVVHLTALRPLPPGDHQTSVAPPA